MLFAYQFGVEVLNTSSLSSSMDNITPNKIDSPVSTARPLAPQGTNMLGAQSKPRKFFDTEVPPASLQTAPSEAIKP